MNKLDIQPDALATLVHISDLHFGQIDPASGAVKYDSHTPKFWANYRRFDGLMGHSARALLRLSEFFNQVDNLVEGPNNRPRLIVTGDLTTMGSPKEFELAEQYLGGVLPGSRMGLNIPDWKEWSVPGNHDRWGGQPWIFGGPTQAFYKRFSGSPFGPIWLPLTGGRSICFIGIDTDANVGSYSRDRLLARGDFTSQLVKAEALIGPPQDNEIRVLLLHHSRIQNGRTLRMRSASRDALDEFLVEQDIAVILTGHSHDLHVDEFHVTHNKVSINVLEARCGTTTQKDTLPYNFRTVLGRRPQWNKPVNSLLVHQLIEKSGVIKWHTATYIRNPFGFERKGPKKELTVWPR